MKELIRTRPAGATAATLHTFVAEHRAGLWHAARLLGGYEGAALVEDLAARLANDDDMSDCTRRRARAVLALLTLKNVGNPDRVESGYFAVIDPADPAVEEICLLADGLGDALEGSNAPEEFRTAA